MNTREVVDGLTAISEALCEEWYALTEDKRKKRIAAGGIEEEYIARTVAFLIDASAPASATRRKRRVRWNGIRYVIRTADSLSLDADRLIGRKGWNK